MVFSERQQFISLRDSIVFLKVVQSNKIIAILKNMKHFEK